MACLQGFQGCFIELKTFQMQSNNPQLPSYWLMIQEGYTQNAPNEIVANQLNQTVLFYTIRMIVFYPRGALTLPGFEGFV